MGQVITFAQQKGGAGKTTILVHLAHSWLLAGRSVAVIDLDPQQSLTRWLELAKMPGLVAIESRDYRVGADLRQATREHDLVLLDCPGNASNLLEAAIRGSDLVLVPCQPTAMDVWATEPILRQSEREKTRCVVVLNRVAPRGGAVIEATNLLVKAGATVLASHLGNRVAFAAGFAKGRTSLSLSFRSNAAREVEALRAEIEVISGATGQH